MNATTPDTKPMTYSKKWQDNDECGCCLCGKPLKGAQRHIYIANGGTVVVRVDLVDASGERATLSDGTKTSSDIGWVAVGSTCAKKFGLAYSKEIA